MRTNLNHFLLGLLIAFSGQLSAQISFWGLTSKGGTNNVGAIYFTDDQGGQNTIVHSFSYGEGDSPLGMLTMGSDDMLYGTTPGANIDYGTLFQIDPISFQYRKMHAFPSGDNGMYPTGFLLAHSDGKLYGMTRNGGTDQSGTIFEYTPGDTFVTIKKYFTGVDGAHPEGGLILANNNMLYGVTSYGGINNSGVIFEFDPATEEYTNLFDFGPVNGAIPVCTLLQVSNGKLYGVTPKGGTFNAGVLFEYDITSDTYTKLIDFDGITTGSEPVGSLIEAGNGKLYGLTKQNEIAETNTFGTIYSYDIINYQFNRLFVFSGINGSSPTGSLLQIADDKLAGVTDEGGESNKGVRFEYNIMSNSFTKKLDFNGNNGSVPVYSKLLRVMNVGITADELGDNISVYPNPASDRLVIKTGKHSYQSIKYSITDVQGKLLMEGESAHPGNLVITTSALPPGTYLLQLNPDTQYLTRVFIIR